MGVEISTVKSYKKQLRELCKKLDRDFFGLPISQEARDRELCRIARRAVAFYKCENANEDHKDVDTAVRW